MPAACLQGAVPAQDAGGAARSAAQPRVQARRGLGHRQPGCCARPLLPLVGPCPACCAARVATAPRRFARSRVVDCHLPALQPLAAAHVCLQPGAPAAAGSGGHHGAARGGGGWAGRWEDGRAGGGRAAGWRACCAGLDSSGLRPGSAAAQLQRPGTRALACPLPAVQARAAGFDLARVQEASIGYLSGSGERAPHSGARLGGVRGGASRGRRAVLRCRPGLAPAQIRAGLNQLPPRPCLLTLNRRRRARAVQPLRHLPGEPAPQLRRLRPRLLPPLRARGARRRPAAGCAAGSVVAQRAACVGSSRARPPLPGCPSC